MILKDWWKSKPHSMQGGLIGAIVALIPSLIHFYAIITTPPDISYISAWWPLVLLFCAIFITVFAGIGALIGWIIGWIIGKIKSRN